MSSRKPADLDLFGDGQLGIAETRESERHRVTRSLVAELLRLRAADEIRTALDEIKSLIEQGTLMNDQGWPEEGAGGVRMEAWTRRQVDRLLGRRTPVQPGGAEE